MNFLEDLCDWQLTNDLQSGKITIREADGRSYVRFYQNTTSAPYTDDEFDLLLAADARAPAYDIAKEMLAESEQPSLSQLSGLFYTADQQIFQAIQGNRNASPLDYAGTVQGINFVSDAGQVFHYQVWSSDSRGQRWNGDWFDRSLAGDMYVGVNDDVGVYSQPFQEVGASARSYALDVLARVKSLIVNSPVADLDRDLSHWRIQGLYVGGVANGTAVLDAEFSNVDLRGYVSRTGDVSYLVDPGFRTAKTLNILSPVVTPILKDLGTVPVPSPWHIASWGISGHSVLQPGTNEHGFALQGFTPCLTPDLLRSILQRLTALEDWRKTLPPLISLPPRP